MKYRIKAGATGYTVENARSKQDALKQWLDNQSYETIGQAAREHFCKPEDITVSPYPNLD